ncbi:MAG: glutaredoxin 3 [Gemmobacter sp.]
MKSVEIYTTPLCGYCHAAKRLLTRKGAAFTEIDLSREPARRAEMMQRASGGRTVPQIFIGGRHVGGADDLHALDHAGRLDALLAD